jgi:ATPase subunit of ABC transporter with duplicated ATPase domains
MNFLSVENLTKSFGDRLIFSDITFGIDQGDKVAIVAKNGNGKTTLLRCLMNLEDTDSGRVVYRNDLRVAFMQQTETLRKKGENWKSDGNVRYHISRGQMPGRKNASSLPAGRRFA